ncbi:16S rRNA methyltransferase [Buchnera aphidicola (Aphis glycines)]|uniref:Ribosomal RNA small subunit methyltransferase H n=1 Tax=Buchnera aphidicola (Aphis glycines) TaxID=1265350 RepID=A0A0M4HG00_9GAMM|nr:16S rRNA (cytosine(1402)-N(4))-methyltransferase RsmH [Buchnera aphidicola]ALD15182.1 16S rRNA methyltransferase [Buchnera aphidicola (Aphis glycines)]
MNQNTKHIPVMKKELIDSLKIQKNGIYIDSTFGMGGHSTAILKKLGKNGKLYAIDQDVNSVLIGRKIQDKRFYIKHDSFSRILNYAKSEKIINKVDGILFDLGISSSQIEDYKRGFSFKKNGPLDMRMNQTCGIKASDWIVQASTKKIIFVLKKFGEERFAKKIAYAIKDYNRTKKITETLELVNIINKAIPKKNAFKHPARRTFQAIRIYINQELKAISNALEDSLKILKPGGRITVISFHSLEDRIIKKFMVKHSVKASVPYGMPITEKEIDKLKICKLKIIHRILPTYEEIQKNPKSRSSILRTAELKKYE